VSKPAYVAFATILIVPALAFAALQDRYDREYAVIQYAASEPSGAVARLQERIDAGELSLHFDEARGYLPALLEALDIDVSSQMLAFAKTSLQVSKISPATPRAIYFNDTTYVAWVQGGLIEISAADPRLGVVFYTLAQDQAAPPRFERETVRCLQCHDSYSLTGGGVPRHLVGSGLIGTGGELASHESWFVATDQTPLRRRWGGWYVTGTHGEQVHRGNLVIRGAEHARTLDLADTGNLTDLDGVVDTDPYLGEYSDIVALLVLEHQTSVQNVITRVGWDTRRALAAARGGDRTPPATQAQVEEIAEPLVGALLMAGQPALTAPIAGTSGFRRHFESLGPHDAQGRSLRQLDMTRRLFRYPLSYVIYSEAFDALPDPSRAYVYRRLNEVLTGRDGADEYEHLSSVDRAGLLEILSATKPEFAAVSERPR